MGTTPHCAAAPLSCASRTKIFVQILSSALVSAHPSLWWQNNLWCDHLWWQNNLDIELSYTYLGVFQPFCGYASSVAVRRKGRPLTIMIQVHLLWFESNLNWVRDLDGKPGTGTVATEETRDPPPGSDSARAVAGRPALRLRPQHRAVTRWDLRPQARTWPWPSGSYCAAFGDWEPGPNSENPETRFDLKAWALKGLGQCIAQAELETWRCTLSHGRPARGVSMRRLALAMIRLNFKRKGGDFFQNYP